ncbi:MAG: hypothetical protein J0L96_18600 [Anaerolineae bacterium]|nr:hypothetical protein [Anaerolineae bacterium]
MPFKTPIIPRINKFILFGFQPLFDEPIEASVEKNRLLVLGGNGLGKTTILQSIIYCVAGEADSEIESNKEKRWGRKYFHGRIENFNDAYVQVDFFLGEDMVTLKRGFKSSRLLSFNLNDQVLGNNPDSEKEFEDYLRESIGYQSINDFRFLVHKLCYLPEDRSNLVWDSENQIRLMMLLFGDIIDETEFREKRSQLKMLDSQKRHINVDWNAVKGRLATEFSVKTENKKQSNNEIEGNVSEKPILLQIDDQDEVTLLQKLNNVSEEKALVLTETKRINKELTQLAEEIENIQNTLFEIEEAFILDKLDKVQTEEVRLALHKLIHRQICPSCGEKAEELSKQAQVYKAEGRCPLCGSKHSLKKSDKEDYPLIEAQLSEKMRAKLSLEQNFIEQERFLQNLEEQENLLQFTYNKIKLNQYNINPSEEFSEEEINIKDVKISSEKNLKKRARELELNYLEVEKSFNDLQRKLEKKYNEFTKIANERVIRLGELYETYATSFLGTRCELGKRTADIKFLSLDLFVPKFNGQIRSAPEDCSEAQRFFLDIAFRMSVIDLAKELSQAKGTFICETPENALDVTYIENVAKMFRDFSKEGHSLIASGNLQPAGLAGPMLFDIAKKSRSKSILNLLNYGKLSDVQENNRSALEAVYNEDVLGFNGF